MLIVGMRCDRTRRWRRRAERWRARSPTATAWSRDGLERLQRAAHGGRVARRPASISASCRAKDGRDVEGILAGCESKGEIEVVFLIGADEIDTGRLGNAFVIYQGHHGDQRCFGRRRDPAGRRLHRKERDLRQHRGPAAARRSSPCSRRARPRRTGRSCARWRTSWTVKVPLDTLGPGARHAWRRSHRHWAIDRRGDTQAGTGSTFGQVGEARPGTRSRTPVTDFHLTDPHQPGLRGHGRMQRASFIERAEESEPRVPMADLWAEHGLWPRHPHDGPVDHSLIVIPLLLAVAYLTPMPSARSSPRCSCGRAR